MEKFLRDFLRRFEILREIFCVGLGIYGVKDAVFGGWLDMMHDLLRFERLKNGAFKRLGVRHVQVCTIKLAREKGRFGA